MLTMPAPPYENPFTTYLEYLMSSFEHPRVHTYGSMVPNSPHADCKGHIQITSTHSASTQFLQLSLSRQSRAKSQASTQLPHSSYISQVLVNSGHHPAEWTSSKSAATSGDLRTSSENADVSRRLCDVAVKATRHTLRYHVGAEV